MTENWIPFNSAADVQPAIASGAMIKIRHPTRYPLGLSGGQFVIPLETFLAGAFTVLRYQSPWEPDHHFGSINAPGGWEILFGEPGQVGEIRDSEADPLDQFIAQLSERLRVAMPAIVASTGATAYDVAVRILGDTMHEHGLAPEAPEVSVRGTGGDFTFTPNPTDHRDWSKDPPGKVEVRGGSDGATVRVDLVPGPATTGTLHPDGTVTQTADDGGPLERVTASRGHVLAPAIGDIVVNDPGKLTGNPGGFALHGGHLAGQLTGGEAPSVPGYARTIDANCKRQAHAEEMASDALWTTVGDRDGNALEMHPRPGQTAEVLARVVGVLHRIGAIDEAGLAELLRDE